MSEVRTAEAGVPAGKPRTYGSIVWGQLRKCPSAIGSLVVIVLLALVALFAPFLGGAVPIRWVEGGKASWPITRHLSNLEYAAMLAFALMLALPVTVRLVRRRAEAAGGSPWGRAFLLLLAIWVLATVTLEAVREDQVPPPDYLVRRGDADSAWFPLIAYPREPGFRELEFRDEPPSWEHPLGTGRNGNDVLIGLLHGARTAMTIGIVTVGISSAIGVTLGAFSGYFVGWTDLLFMRIAEIFMCIPRLILVILILTVMPVRVPPLWTVVVVLGVTGWTGTYRLMRAELLRIRTEDYMTAARAGHPDVAASASPRRPQRHGAHPGWRDLRDRGRRVS